MTKATTARTGGLSAAGGPAQGGAGAFLAGEETGRTLAQAAIKFALYRPAIISVLPNFTNLDELRDYTDAVDVPDITDGEQALLDELWEYNFDLAEAPVNLTEV